jgi:hypothetical protein
VTENERDDALSRLFEAERRADESAAPPLDALLARAIGPRVSPVRAVRQLDVAAALAAILAAGALVLRSGATRPASPAPAAAETVRLADWESPTAFLLDTPGDELLTQIPSFDSPPTSDGAPAPSPTEGVAR